MLRIRFLLGLAVGLALAMATAGAAAELDDAGAVSRSLAHLQAQAPVWGIRDPTEEFRLRGIERDTLGETHVRLDQMYQGLPVFGRQLIVHLDRAGDPRLITGAYLPGLTLSTHPAISADQAEAVAQERFPGALSRAPETEAVIFPRKGTVYLVYRVVLSRYQTPRRVVVFIDATSGRFVHSYNDLPTSPAFASPGKVATQTIAPTAAPALGTGYSLYSGVVTITTDAADGVYSMVDPTRGNNTTVDMQDQTSGSGVVFTDSDNIWGDGTSADRQSAAVDVHFGTQVTWDYYLNVHGRAGIKNDGVGIVSQVHWGPNANNNYWEGTCECAVYGDGDGIRYGPLVSLDAVGHEITHGVNQFTADLIYDNESGGLNESMSFIFGTMVEFYAAAQGVPRTPNYWWAEDYFTPGIPGDADYYLDDPTLDGKSIDTYADYNDDLNVHLTTGVSNNAFYLLAEGGTHRLGGVVTGIGRSAAERIFYRALTAYMIPSETFAMARAHTTQAAIDLFGEGSQEVISVGEAWSAVGVATTTTLVASSTPSVPGLPVTFTAIVRGGPWAPTGTVTLVMDDATTLGTVAVDSTGQAMLTIDSIPVGQHTIAAVYSGSDTCPGSVGTLVYTVTATGSATTVASSSNSTVSGQKVTFTATVQSSAGTPTGTVTFVVDGTTTYGVAPVTSSGQAKLTSAAIPIGLHVVVAIYSGDAEFPGSTGTITHQVVQAATTTTIVAANNPSAWGQVMSFTAQVTAVAPGGGIPTGNVEFMDGPDRLKIVTLDSSGRATYTGRFFSSGTHPITAVYDGDPSYTGSTSPTLSQIVRRR